MFVTDPRNGVGARSAEECRRIYKAALRCLTTHRGHVRPETFIRELDMTASCDHVHDLAALRRDIEHDLGGGRPDALERIRAYRESLEDARRAAQVVFRHADAAAETLRAVLSVTEPR